MRARSTTRAGATALLLSALMLCSEAGLRMAGVIDVPLYRPSATLGYIPKANQHGFFMRRNAWVFNERSMGTKLRFKPNSADILLLGDSIVLGGVWLPQERKLGPMLQRIIGRQVWPLSAGSWALSNELTALSSEPDLQRVGTIIIATNRGDFGAASVWRSEYTHPTHYPISVLWYVGVKKLLGIKENPFSATGDLATKRWHRQLANFLAGYHGHILWLFYPTKNEAGHSCKAFSDLAFRIKMRARAICVASDPRWNASLYRDGIHPDAQGNSVLASIIADALKTKGLP